MAATPSPALTRGHKKKARTRQLLLDTALELLIERGEGFSVADLATRAGVSHGTFYNYFSDREQLVQALVPHIVERFADRLAGEVTEADPAARFARISARALDAAAKDQRTVRVALRIDAVQRGLLLTGPLAHLRDDLLEGCASGRFAGPLDDGTLDVVLGTLLLAARRIADGETGIDYRTSVLRRLLQSLGVEAEEAGRIASDATAAT